MISRTSIVRLKQQLTIVPVWLVAWSGGVGDSGRGARVKLTTWAEVKMVNYTLLARRLPPSEATGRPGEARCVRRVQTTGRVGRDASGACACSQ